MRQLLVVLLLGLYLALVPRTANASPDCMYGLRGALIAGGYSGSVDCTKVRFQIRKVGSKKEGNLEVLVYDLIYQTIVNGFGVSHGGERLLIFENEKYVGEYVLSPPPFATPTIVGNDIIFDSVPKGEGNVIHLGKRGLPTEVWVGGTVINLYK